MSTNKYPIIVILITFFLWAIILFVIPNDKEVVFNGSTMGTTYEVKVIDNISSYHKDIIQFNELLKLSQNSAPKSFVLWTDNGIVLN